jgi:hypothetical protein
MSQKEPKSAKNMSAEQAVENLFHPKASGNAKKHAEGAKNRGRKAHNGWMGSGLKVICRFCRAVPNLCPHPAFLPLSASLAP